jgi:NADH-quinone oxidoreductase subunit J
MEYIFLAFSFSAVLMGIYILVTDNILYAALALIGVFLSTSGIYVLSSAPFLAVTQIMVYIGGVLILILFGIMITRKHTNHNVLFAGKRNLVYGLLLSAGLVYVIVNALILVDFESLRWIQEGSTQATTLNNTNALGQTLMQDYILPFELAAVMLLIVLIGSVYIAGKKEEA